MDYEVPFSLVEKAAPIVRRRVKRTPLVASEWLSSVVGAEVFLKCENLQVTGSFKVRGPFVKLARPSVRKRGVIASSAGNHGAGLAYAARTLGVACTIVAPRTIPKVKADKIRRLGATLEIAPYDDYDSAEEHARAMETGAAFVSPFDDADIIAGNGGTLALEIVEETPGLDLVVSPCGGGGLCGGLGVVLREKAPRAELWAVNSEASPGMSSSRRDGVAHLRVMSKPTIAEGLEGGVSANTFELGRRVIDGVVEVRESTLARAVAELYWRHGMTVEGAGAAGVAALLEGGLPKGRRKIAVVISGGNIDAKRLRGILAGHPDPRESAVLWREQQAARFPASAASRELEGRPLKDLDASVGLALLPVLGEAGAVRALTGPERERLVRCEDVLGRVLEEVRLDEEGVAYFGRLHRIVTEVLRRGG